MSDSDYRWMRNVGSVVSIGMLIMISIAIGLGLGYWLDSKLGTKPWLAFVFTLLGLAAGLYESVKILIEVTRDGDS